ncbi:MAG: DUF2079 domain-containing protein [Anaerolineae bacterium]
MTRTNNIFNFPVKVSSRRSFAISIPTILLWFLILAYIVFFSAYTLQRHATFNTFAADLSYIDQPMWNTFHGHFLERTLDARQVPRTAEHLEPIIVPIAFVYYLWDDVRAILIVQTVALALGALPVYWIAREAFTSIKSQWLPFAFVVAYLMFPALQAANVADFHADPFVVAPLLFAFWYATQRRYRAMWAWAIVAMLVKENLPTLTFMLGLYLFFAPGNRGSRAGESDVRESKIRGVKSPHSLIFSLPDYLLTRRRLHGLALMVVSLAWFYVATFLIVAPLARQVYGTEGPIYLSSRYAGSGNGLTGLLAHPGNTLALVREPDRLRYLAGLFASVGWLALLAPEYLLLGLPVLVANTLSNFPGQYSGEQHYSAPLAPVFIIAAIYGFQRLVRGLSNVSGLLPLRLFRRTGIGKRGSRFSGLSRLSLRRYHATTFITVWLLAWSLGYHYVRGWTPLARDFVWPQRTPHNQLLARFAAQIPPDAPLSTTPPLHPHLAHREKIYIFPTVADADYVLLDVASRTDVHPNDVRATFDALVESGEFGVVDAAEGYLLLKRGQGTGGKEQALPNAFYDFARVQDARPQYPATIEFDNRLRFLGYDVLDDPKWGETSLRLYWQVLTPLPNNLRLWPFIFGEDGALIEDTSQRPMVVPLWYPLSQWQPGEIIVTETLPWDLGPRFNIGLAVLRSAPGASEKVDPVTAFADPTRRLPITAAGPGVILFHGNTWAQVGAFGRSGRYLALVSGDLSLSPLNVTFANGIRLTGYRISSTQSQISDSPSPISVILQWQPTTPIPRDYTIFIHLVGPDGTIVTQSDARPTWVVPWPANQWSPDQPVLDGHRLPFPPDLSPGRYQVQVGLYYWESLERLPVLDETMQQKIGDYVVLGEIEIEP